MAADNSSSSASSNKASGAPSNFTNTPARPGPATSAPELASALRACASTSRWRGTTWVSTIWAALPANMLTAPMMKPTAYSTSMRSQPSHQVNGTASTARAMVNSPTT